MHTKLKTYGHFDPSFPSISINFPDEDIWNKYEEVENIDQLRLIEMFKKHTDWDFTPENLSKFLFEFNGFSIESIESYGDYFIEKYREEVIDVFMISSTHMHERRHFHDWLLCPNTSFVNAIKLSLCFNTHYSYYWLTHNSNKIPVPLSKWSRLKKNERDLILDNLNYSLKKEEIVLPKILDHPDFIKSIKTVDQNYELINSIFKPIDHNINMHISTIFETSAFCIQVQTIHDKFGEKAKRIVEDHVRQQKMNYDYLTGYTFYSYLNSSTGEILENEIILKLVTWCQLGNQIVDAKNSNPFHRFFILNEFIKTYGIPKVGVNSNDLYKKIDKFGECESYKKCLIESLELPFVNDDNTDHCLSFILEHDKDYFDEIMAIHKYLNESRKGLVNIFLEDADIYTNPIKYANYVGNWIEPSIIFNFQKPFYKLEQDEINLLDNVEFFKTEGNQTFIKSFKKESFNTFDYNIAKEWLWHNDFNDILYSINKRDGVNYSSIIEDFKQRGIHLFEVF
jgi:hypothetical protein